MTLIRCGAYNHPDLSDQSSGKRPRQGKVKDVFYAPMSEADGFTRGPARRYIFIRMAWFKPGTVNGTGSALLTARDQPLHANLAMGAGHGR